MIQAYLINILIFCAIILLIVIIVGAVQAVIVMIDVRRSTKEVTKKVRAITSALDIVALLFGGLGRGKKKAQSRLIAPDEATIVPYIAGVKKALQVLLKKREG